MTWRPAPLKRFLQLNDSGAWGDDPEPGQSTTRVVRSTDIRLDGSWDLADVARRHLSDRDLRRTRLEPGDLVVVTSSGSADHLGKTAIVDEVVAEQDASFSNFVQRLRPSADADGRYLRYFLSSNVASFEFGRLGTTSTGLRNLSGGLLGSVACPGPPVDEQRRIADFLDTEAAGIDALITAKQQMADGLIASRMDTMRAGVAGEVVSGDRSKASLAWLPELPTHWGMAKLTLLARLGSGHTPSRSRPEWWMNPTIPWITTGEVAQMRSDRIELILETREMISELGMANSSAELHPAGTVVLCRTASAGYSAIMGGPMAVSQDFATWTCGPHLDPRFLLLCLRAMRRDLLERLAMGSTHKTIYMPDIESIRVPVPPMDEQHRLVEWVWSRLRRIDAIVDTLTAQIALLRERRQALITAAVTGEIEV